MGCNSYSILILIQCLYELYLSLKYFIFNYVHTCASVCRYVHVSAHVSEGQKRMLGLLELDL